MARTKNEETPAKTLPVMVRHGSTFSHQSHAKLFKICRDLRKARIKWDTGYDDTARLEHVFLIDTERSRSRRSSSRLSGVNNERSLKDLIEAGDFDESDYIDNEAMINLASSDTSGVEGDNVSNNEGVEMLNNDESGKSMEIVNDNESVEIIEPEPQNIDSEHHNNSSDDEVPLSALFGKTSRNNHIDIGSSDDDDDDHKPISSLKSKSPPLVRRNTNYKRIKYVLEDSEDDISEIGFISNQRKSTNSMKSKDESAEISNENALSSAVNFISAMSMENKLRFGSRRDNRPAWMARQEGNNKDDNHAKPSNSSDWSKSESENATKTASSGWSSNFSSEKKSSTGWTSISTTNVVTSASKNVAENAVEHNPDEESNASASIQGVMPPGLSDNWNYGEDSDEENVDMIVTDSSSCEQDKGGTIQENDKQEQSLSTWSSPPAKSSNSWGSTNLTLPIVSPTLEAKSSSWGATATPNNTLTSNWGSNDKDKKSSTAWTSTKLSTWSEKTNFDGENTSVGNDCLDLSDPVDRDLNDIDVAGNTWGSTKSPTEETKTSTWGVTVSVVTPSKKDCTKPSDSAAMGMANNTWSSEGKDSNNKSSTAWKNTKSSSWGEKPDGSSKCSSFGGENTSTENTSLDLPDAANHDLNSKNVTGNSWGSSNKIPTTESKPSSWGACTASVKHAWGSDNKNSSKPLDNITPASTTNSWSSKDKDDNGCNSNSLSDTNKSSTGWTNVTASSWGKDPGDNSKCNGFSTENKMNVNDECLDLLDPEIRNMDTNDSNSKCSGFGGENTSTENTSLDLLDAANHDLNNKNVTGNSWCSSNKLSTTESKPSSWGACTASVKHAWGSNNKNSSKQLDNITPSSTTNSWSSKDKDDNDTNKSSTGWTSATASSWGENPGDDSKCTGFSIENTMNVNDECLDLPDPEIRDMDVNDTKIGNSWEISQAKASTWGSTATPTKNAWGNQNQCSTKLSENASKMGTNTWPKNGNKSSEGWKSTIAFTVGDTPNYESEFADSGLSAENGEVILNDNDVFKGKQDHPGTIKYKELLKTYVGDARIATYGSVAKKILSRLRSVDPPARILKKVREGCLEQITEDRLIIYISADLAALLKDNKKNDVVMTPSGEAYDDARKNAWNSSENQGPSLRSWGKTDRESGGNTSNPIDADSSSSGWGNKSSGWGSRSGAANAIRAKAENDMDGVVLSGVPWDTANDSTLGFGADEKWVPDSAQYSERDELADEDYAQLCKFPAPALKKAIPAGKKTKDLCVRSSEDIVVPVERDSEDDEYFLKWLIGERLLIKEKKLSNSTLLEMEFTKHATKYALLATKSFNSKGNKFSKFERPWIRVFYVALDDDDGDLSSSLALKKEFEKLGDFGKLETRKVASRFELMVSTARKGPGDAPLMFVLDSDDFEIIDENYHDGCGFIPSSMMLDKFGLDPSLYTAIQVRVICPKLGWFKGMLMLKPDIDRVQLPTSMRKVEKSSIINDNDDDYDWAHVLIKNTFPSKNNRAVNQILNPHLPDPCKTALKDLKDTNADNVMRRIGIPEEVIQEYMRQGREYLDCHKHASCVGVADPTNSLPKGSVFVTGLGRDSSDIDIVITREPNTEQDDVKVLRSIRRKPPGMDKSDWDFLFKLPFGLVLFAPPSNGDKSIPETIAGGDLDGDLYHICWDDKIVQIISDGKSPTPVNDYVKYDDELADSDEEIVNCSNSRRRIAAKILDHRGKGGKASVQIKWKNRPKPTWETVTKALRQDEDLEDMLVEYAIKHNLSGEYGWGWCKFGIKDISILRIKDHTLNPLRLIIEWDNGEVKKETMEDMRDKWEAGELVAEYGARNGLLNRKDWKWAKQFNAAKKDWFQRAQEHISKAYLIYEQDRLRKELCSIYKKEKFDKGIQDKDVIVLGRAYKQSNDILKHGGKVDYPLHMHKLIKEDALHKHLNYFDINGKDETMQEPEGNE